MWRLEGVMKVSKVLGGTTPLNTNKTPLSILLQMWSPSQKLDFQNGEYQQKLKSIDDSAIQPIHVICPIAMECETASCSGHYLSQNTREHDIPHVTLIKGAKMFKGTHILSRKCSQCDTIYYADHESPY